MSIGPKGSGQFVAVVMNKYNTLKAYCVAYCKVSFVLDPY